MPKPKRPTQHYPLVEVVWDDPTSLPDGWAEKGTVPQHVETLCLSVGFMVARTEDYIILAQDTDTDGEHNTRSRIPSGVVKSLKVLRKADE